MSATIQDNDLAESLEAGAPTDLTAQNAAGRLPGSGSSRVYRGSSVEELIPKIEAELGGDAIVLRRRSGLTGGVGGFFQRQFVEIEACASQPRVDLYDEPELAALVPEMPPAPPARAPLRGPARAASPESSQRANGTPAPYPPGAVPWPSAQTPPLEAPGAQGLAGRRPLTTAQQRAYADLYARVPAPEPALAPGFSDHANGAIDFQPFPAHQPPRPPAPEALSQTAPERPMAVPPGERSRAPITMAGGESFAAALAEAEAAVPGEPVREQLLSIGVGEPLVNELIETAATVALPLMGPHATLRDAVRLVLRLMIPTARPLPGRDAAIALVGPRGGGKSACCSGLLARAGSGAFENAMCATLTADARSGEQLLVMDHFVPSPTPISDPHVQEAVRAARRDGLVLFDTPAISHADRPSVYSLAALLDTLSVDLVIVALPATMGAKPAAQMLRSLRPLGAGAMAITHADETDQLGVAVQAACAFGLAPEYLLGDPVREPGLTSIDSAYLAERLLP